MLESWKKALNKYVTGDLTLVPLEKITQSAVYQKEGKPVKDYPNDTDTSIFQKMDSLLGFENIKYSFVAVPGGSNAPNTDLAVPRGLRKFSWIGGEGAAAFKLGHGSAIREIGAEMGIDAAILVNSTFTWGTDRGQFLSDNLKGSAQMTISATLNVPNGRWEEAVKATNQKTYGIAMSPAFRSYIVSLQDVVTVPYDTSAQHSWERCCRDGIGDEAERDIFAPMLAEYDQAVDMIVEKMVANLRSTHKAAVK
ncbi:MAG: hypothetical protein HY809_06220 [Nitrospirae bacterium]|nr:hypothetical protein [Nitrospirota bacterium]